jgi:ubiquitin carboxyl-terminal hydrolase 34
MRLNSVCNPKLTRPGTPIDGQLLPLLAEWLEDLPEPSSDVHAFYASKTVFWDEFAVVVSKVLARRYQWTAALSANSTSTDADRYPLGEHFSDDVETAQIFDRFLAAYVRICSFLLQVDASLLSRSSSDELYPLPLLSQKHIRSLHSIIHCDKAPLFHVLHKEHGTDVRDLSVRLQTEFLKANGAQNLLQLVNKAHDRLPTSTQIIYATYTAPILTTLGWIIFELPGTDTHIDRSAYHRGALSFFQKYGSGLQDTTKPIEALVARDLIVYLSTLVSELCQWDDSIAEELVDRLLDLSVQSSPTALAAPDLARTSQNNYRQDPRCYPALVANAWKFKILRKYIIQGNMGLRVMSIAMMDAALVEIWRDFNRIGPSGTHPVMQYLADFLLHGQVVDYIVSVDSHPQLISRSGNIAGFLVVTHRWSDSQADAIWKTVSTSPDPRVVEATMTMLRGIVGLMKPADHLYLCQKLYDLPIERYTSDILRFLRDLTGRLREPAHSFDYNERDQRARPWNVCIRVLRDTAPSRNADKNLLDLHVDAYDQLCSLGAMIPLDERETIFCECVRQIVERSANATANYRVICFLSQSPYSCSIAFIRKSQNLIHQALEAIPDFVKEEVKAGIYTYQLQALYFKVDLLRLVISHNEMDVPRDLYQDLWDHTVGGEALSNESRDQAWALLLEGIKTSPDDEFCNQLVSSYVPTIDPQHYTNGLFDFVANFNFPTTRQTVNTDTGDEKLLQIPGADLLWPMVLSSPTGTIEDRAASLLATRYVHAVDTDGVTLAEVEKAHIALVEQCMQELRTAIESLPSRSPAITNVEIAEPGREAKARETFEVRVRRILLFQKLFLEHVRRKPEFNRGQRLDSKVDALQPDVPTGDSITVRYQAGNSRDSVTMALDHTLDDLYRRLCHATGLTKINLFARGQKLDIADKGTVKISEVDFGGQVIVQRADGAELSRPLPEPAAGSSVFETAVVKRFDKLFTWMSSADTTSYLVRVQPCVLFNNY